MNTKHYRCKKWFDFEFSQVAQTETELEILFSVKSKFSSFETLNNQQISYCCFVVCILCKLDLFQHKQMCCNNQPWLQVNRPAVSWIYIFSRSCTSSSGLAWEHVWGEHCHRFNIQSNSRGDWTIFYIKTNKNTHTISCVMSSLLQPSGASVASMGWCV